MKGPRFDRILAGMTVAVTLVALFSAFQWGDLTAVPTGVSSAGEVRITIVNTRIESA